MAKRTPASREPAARRPRRKVVGQKYSLEEILHGLTPDEMAQVQSAIDGAAAKAGDGLAFVAVALPSAKPEIRPKKRTKRKTAASRKATRNHDRARSPKSR